MISETCCCGASITADDPHTITQSRVEDWRANHRHDVSKIETSGHDYTVDDDALLSLIKQQRRAASTEHAKPVEHLDHCRDLYCGGCEESKDDAPHADPCDCDDCRPPRTLHRQPDAPTDEPPVGSVARCFGCGNVYVRKADGWVNTDDGSRELAWVGIARSFCGPVKVIYGPGEDA